MALKPSGKMTSAELLELIRQNEQASLGSEVAAGATVGGTIYPASSPITTLEVDRYNALNYYMARPLGNEIENRSQVVLPEVRDTLEWVMPELMRMFVSAKTVCRFEPQSEQDEEQAEVETMVVNHVFMQQNNGVMILHDYFKDALLMRNGYTEVFAKDCEEVTEERYSGLTELEITALLQDNADEDIEIIEQSESLRDVHMPLPQMPPQLSDQGAPQQGLMGSAPQPALPLMVPDLAVFSVKLRRTAHRKRICVSCLPPEEMRISPRTRGSVEDSDFSMHLTTKTRSQLIAEGFDPAIVNKLQAGNPNWMEMDALARDSVVDQIQTDDPATFATQQIEVRNTVLRVDFDGDGLAELRHVLVAGDKIIENEMLEETCFTSCQSMRMPHRHTGISLYELLADIQVIKAQLLRAALDNLAIANNTRVAVDWRNCNLDDLTTSRPGGVVRGNGAPSNWVMPLEQPSNLTSQILPAIEYIDQLKTTRVGVGKQTMGVDADVLQNVTKSAQLAAMSAASLKIELVARLLAEGVKDIFRKIHSELMRHQDKPMSFEISGKWIQVDPSSWRRRTHVSVNVGLGSGNQEQMRQNIMLLGQMQGQLAQMGLIGPQQAYETFKIGCEALGFNNPQRFAMDPKGAEYAQHMKQMAEQQQQVAPQVQAAKIRAQTQLIQEQAENQRAQGKLQAQILQDKLQITHEALQADADRQHQGAQGHKDREIQLDSNHLQIILKLIPAIAQVLAAEKAAPDELGQDVSAAEGQIQ